MCSILYFFYCSQLKKVICFLNLKHKHLSKYRLLLNCEMPQNNIPFLSGNCLHSMFQVSSSLNKKKISILEFTD